jgi:hypothetical protein
MPRYEYRNIQPLPQAEKAFLEWIQKLDEQFTNRNIEHRCTVVREALHELYLGRPYAAPSPSALLAEQALVHSFDPAMRHWNPNITAMWTRKSMPSANP